MAVATSRYYDYKYLRHCTRGCAARTEAHTRLTTPPSTCHSGRNLISKRNCAFAKTIQGLDAIGAKMYNIFHLNKTNIAAPSCRCCVAVIFMFSVSPVYSYILRVHDKNLVPSPCRFFCNLDNCKHAATAHALNKKDSRTVFEYKFRVGNAWGLLYG